MKIGDIVTRKSYNKDIIFKIVLLPLPLPP